MWSAVYILMGLRYDQALVQRLLQGVRGMKESVTYQAILQEGKAEGLALGEAKGIVMGKAEGKAEEARRLLLLLGRDAFGEPSGAVQAAIRAVTDVQRLEQLAIQVKNAASWDELMGLANHARRSRRRKPPV